MKRLKVLMALQCAWTTAAFQSASFTCSVDDTTTTNTRACNSALCATTIRVAVMTDKDEPQQREGVQESIVAHPLMSMMDGSTEFVNLACTKEASNVATFDETVDSLDIACFASPCSVQSWLNSLDHATGAQDESKESRQGNGNVMAASCIGSETARVSLEAGKWQAHNIYYPKGADDLQGWADSAVQEVADLGGIGWILRYRFMLSVALVTVTTGLAWFWQHRRRQAKSTSSWLPPALAASPYHAQLALAIQLARQAGQNMYKYCDQAGSFDLGISTKTTAEDFYTAVDVENEAAVMQGIHEAFPTDAIIGEESVGTAGIPPLSKETPTWIIDPIDGTTNFASGLPLTCVSIGYCVDGVPVLGVVYAPMTQELFLAVKGYGAFRNGVRITSVPKCKNELANSVVCFEFGYSRQPTQVAAMVGVVQRLLNHGCRATRQLGSGVLDLCYVATGRLDAVYAGVAGEGWKPWDFCAGLVIVEEAGCVMEAIDQTDRGPFDISSKSHICATSQALLEEMRKLILQKS